MLIRRLKERGIWRRQVSRWSESFDRELFAHNEFDVVRINNRLIIT